MNVSTNMSSSDVAAATSKNPFASTGNEGHGQPLHLGPHGRNPEDESEVPAAIVPTGTAARVGGVKNAPFEEKVNVDLFPGNGGGSSLADHKEVHAQEGVAYAGVGRGQGSGRGPGFETRERGARAARPLFAEGREQGRAGLEDDRFADAEEAVQALIEQVADLQRRLDRFRPTQDHDEYGDQDGTDQTEEQEGATPMTELGKQRGYRVQPPVNRGAAPPQTGVGTTGALNLRGSSAHGLFGRFLDQTATSSALFRSAPTATVSPAVAPAGGIVRRSAIHVEKEAKGIVQFTGGRLGSDIERLEQALQFIQQVQDAADRYSWTLLEIWLAVASRLGGQASLWFRAWREQVIGAVTWKDFSIDFMREFSGITSQHRASEIFLQSRQQDQELPRLFMARKELLATLAGVDRGSPAGQMTIVVSILKTLNSRTAGLREFYADQSGRTDASQPMRELRRIYDEFQVREDVRASFGGGNFSEYGPLDTGKPNGGARDEGEEPRSRTHRGCWHCAATDHLANKCKLPKRLRVFACKYFPSKAWEKVMEKADPALRARFEKRNGAWTFASAAVESEGHEPPRRQPRRGVRDRGGERREVGALETMGAARAALQATVEQAPVAVAVAQQDHAAAAQRQGGAGGRQAPPNQQQTPSQAGRGTQQNARQSITFAMLDIAIGSASPIELGASGRGEHIVCQAVLSEPGHDSPAGAQIWASVVALPDTGAAGSVMAASLAKILKFAPLIDVRDANIYMGGRQAGFRVPVTQAVEVGVHLPMSPSRGDWNGLESLKGNTWQLTAGRKKTLFYIVPDGVIPCGARLLLGMNVLAPHRAGQGEAASSSCWDIILSQGAIRTKAGDGQMYWSPIEFRSEPRQETPVMQLLALDLRNDAPKNFVSKAFDWAQLTPEEQLILQDKGVSDELMAWKLGVAGLTGIGLRPRHAAKLFVASRARILEVGSADERAAAEEELRVDETTLQEQHLDRLLRESEFVGRLRSVGLFHLMELLSASGVNTLEELESGLTHQDEWLHGFSISEADLQVLRTLVAAPTGEVTLRGVQEMPGDAVRSFQTRTLGEVRLTQGEREALERRGIETDVAVWRFGLDGLQRIGLKRFHAAKLYAASRAHVLSLGSELEKEEAAKEIAEAAAVTQQREEKRLQQEKDFRTLLHDRGMEKLVKPLADSGVLTLDLLKEGLAYEECWLHGTNLDAGDIASLRGLVEPWMWSCWLVRCRRNTRRKRLQMQSWRSSRTGTTIWRSSVHCRMSQQTLLRRQMWSSSAWWIACGTRCGKKVLRSCCSKRILGSARRSLPLVWNSWSGGFARVS